MEYKIVNGSRGVRYMKGSKFCSVKDIPEDILQRLHNQDKVDTSRDCPFCGQPGTEEKAINSKLYLLCKSDYDSKTTGELAEVLRTMDNSTAQLDSNE